MTHPLLAGVIVTHAGLATALNEAVARVAGDSAGLVTVSNEGCSADEIRARVAAALDGRHDDGTIVFVDLAGGSCAVASLVALEDRDHVRILSGVNLAMLVDFALRRGDLSLDAMVERLLQRGKASIQELKV